LNRADNITIRANEWGSQDDDQPTGHVLTYQKSLRVIGQYLDQQRIMSYGITESENGFIVNPLKRSSLQMAETPFSECVLQELLRDAVDRRGGSSNPMPPLRLFGTSSEDLLRSIGYKLDARRARMVAVAVLPSRVVVCGWQPASNPRASASEPFELILDLPSVRLLLFEACSRRNHHQPVRVESAMSESERRLAHRMSPLEIDDDSRSIFSN
jgi:hypothetical protein